MEKIHKKSLITVRDSIKPVKKNILKIDSKILKNSVSEMEIFSKSDLKNPFSTINFSKVTLFTLGLKQDIYTESIFKIIDDDSVVLYEVDEKKVLSKNQIDEFFTIVCDTNTYGGINAACFLPKHGLIFSDKDDKIIAYIEICMMCNYLNSYPTIPAKFFSYEVTKDNNGKNRPIYHFGFSPTGRARLVAFFKKLKLSYTGNDHFSIYQKNN